MLFLYVFLTLIILCTLPWGSLLLPMIVSAVFWCWVGDVVLGVGLWTCGLSPFTLACLLLFLFRSCLSSHVGDNVSLASDIARRQFLSKFPDPLDTTSILLPLLLCSLSLGCGSFFFLMHPLWLDSTTLHYDWLWYSVVVTGSIWRSSCCLLFINIFLILSKLVLF